MAQRLQVLAVCLTVLVTPAQSQDYWWQEARAGVVRDRLYIEGGGLGHTLAPGVVAISQGGGLTQFNFSTSFESSTSFTTIYQNVSDTTAPGSKPHLNGYMFADDDEFYSFGGRAFASADSHYSFSEILRGAIFIPNADAKAAQLGIATSADFDPQRGNSTTDNDNYITNGAGVSVPSESLGFYFSGLRTQNGSEINWNAQSYQPTFPSVLSNTMLRVNTTLFGDSEWSQIPLPANVPPRADAVLAWIPVGARGAVVVIGGVPFPASVFPTCDISGNSTQASANSIADSLMTSLSIYDIATGAWYNQNTTGQTPPQLAQACAVVAYPNDRSVFNIYVHGGFSGIDKTAPSDAVWVLSLPSFTWVQVSAGTSSHARYAHVCAKPYPDQMMIVGGAGTCNGPLTGSAFADVFNLNTLTWQGKYDPSVWSEYTVNSTISNAIATPTASMVTPLASLLSTRYTRNITSYYPYKSTSKPTEVPQNPNQPSTSHNKWLIPVVVVIAILAAIAAGITLWRCATRKKREASQSGGSRRSVVAWIRGHQHAKSVRSEDDMTQVEPSPVYHEADGYFKRPPQTHVAELTAPDSSVASPLDSPFHSPGGRSPLGAVSPSSPSSAELYSPPTRYELPGELPGNFVAASNIKSHPLFPPNVSGTTSSVQSPRSVSSPSFDAITPYELPRKRSNEDGLEAPPNDMILGESSAIVEKTPKSPRITASQMAGDPISPSLSAATASPDQGPMRPPMTPPPRPFDPNVIRTVHTRNTSSLSSGLPDLSSPSPREDVRRSATIAALPEPASTVSLPSPAEATMDEVTKPASPERREASIDKTLRRKELRSYTPVKTAYNENEDMYGAGRDTV